MIKIIDDFQKMGRKAGAELDTKYSVSEVEPTFLEMLNTLKDYPQNKEQFISCILNMLDEGIVPFEAIQFSMRALKWEEVKQGIIDRLEESEDPRVHSVMNELLAVFEDEWEDEDLYQYYSK
ncbi:MAG: hypothetical protein GXP08_14640 [Gammaproteobacteria bacterium]|nr:hypothetical protein [Gammaproteobacteria bacterium]